MAASLLGLLEESNELLNSPELVSRGSRRRRSSLLGDDGGSGRSSLGGLGLSRSRLSGGGLRSVTTVATLDALGVVRVLLLAGVARHTGAGASIALTTALAVGLDCGAGVTRVSRARGRLGLGDSSKSGGGSRLSRCLRGSTSGSGLGGLSSRSRGDRSSRAALDLLQPGNELSHAELSVASGLSLEELGEGVDIVLLVASLRGSGGLRSRGGSSSGSGDLSRLGLSGRSGSGRGGSSRGGGLSRLGLNGRSSSSGSSNGSLGRGSNGSGGGRGSSTAGGLGCTGNSTEGQELRVGLRTASVQGGAGHGVLAHVLVDRETKARASLRVSLRELDTGRSGGTGAGDLELVASDVVLSTTSGGGSVKSDSLSTEEVVTGSDVRGDGEVELSAVVVEVLSAPVVVVTLGRARGLLPSVLVDLEELRGTISGGGILDLGKIGHNGTPMGTANALLLAAAAALLLVHLNSFILLASCLPSQRSNLRDCVTSREAALARSSSRVDVALQSSGCVVLNGAVGGGKTSACALKVLSVFPELLPCGVGVCQRSHTCENSDGLHDGRMSVGFRKE